MKAQPPANIEPSSGRGVFSDGGLALTDHTVKRDRWSRPWVAYQEEPLRFEKGRKTPTNAYAARRVSSIGSALEDKSTITPWAQANAVVGMVRQPALMAQVASIASKFDNPWYVPEAKRPLQGLIRDAERAGGGDNASGLGTSLHEFTEIIDSGGSLGYVPAELAPWLEAYESATAPLEVVGIEEFVVDDELRAAGSLDRLVRLPDGAVVVADIKTGASNDRYPLGVTVQCSVYANSRKYDQVTGRREALHPDLDKSRGLLIHMPLRSGKPQCNFYMLDLEDGYERAQLANKVFEARKMDALKPFNLDDLEGAA